MRTWVCIAGSALCAAHTLAAQSPLVVTRPTTVAGDLPSVRVMDTARSSVFRVYYDSASRAVAFATIPTLADMYATIAELSGASAARVEWCAVVFVRDRDYHSPRIGTEVRWPVTIEEDGTLGAQGTRDLFVTVPHEQVHAVQTSMVGRTPRWFSEGQAEWVGFQTSARYRPEMAAQVRATHVEAARNAQAHLRAWGSVQPKPEAILRQMTPEQREHHERDPSYMPPGPFKFNADDLISDESQVVARYGAALLLFEDWSRVAGAAGLSKWFHALWIPATPLTTDQLVHSAEEQFRMNVAARLQ